MYNLEALTEDVTNLIKKDSRVWSLVKHDPNTLKAPNTIVTHIDILNAINIFDLDKHEKTYLLELLSVDITPVLDAAVLSIAVKMGYDSGNQIKEKELRKAIQRATTTLTDQGYNHDDITLVVRPEDYYSLLTECGADVSPADTLKKHLRINTVATSQIPVYDSQNSQQMPKALVLTTKSLVKPVDLSLQIEPTNAPKGKQLLKITLPLLVFAGTKDSSIIIL